MNSIVLRVFKVTYYSKLAGVLKSSPKLLIIAKYGKVSVITNKMFKVANIHTCKTVHLLSAILGCTVPVH